MVCMRSLLEGNKRDAEIIRPDDRLVGIERSGNQGLPALPQHGIAAANEVVEVDRLPADALDGKGEAKLVAKEGRCPEVDLEADRGQTDAARPEQDLPRMAHGAPPLFDHAVEQVEI